MGPPDLRSLDSSSNRDPKFRRYSASHAWPCPKTIPSPTLCIIFAFSLHLGFAFLLPCHVGLHWSLHCFLHCHVGLHFQLSFFCIVKLASIVLCIFTVASYRGSLFALVFCSLHHTLLLCTYHIPDRIAPKPPKHSAAGQRGGGQPPLLVSKGL